jgi:hypothetical protein
VHRSLRRDVIGVAAMASNERIVFLAKYALTDAEFDGSHRISVSSIDFRAYCSGFWASANGLRGLILANLMLMANLQERTRDAKLSGVTGIQTDALFEQI